MMLTLKGDAELQKMVEDLLSDGKRGEKIFRKGLRAGMKVIAKAMKDTYPRKSGKAASSVKVKAMTRKRGRIGMRVSLFALSQAGFPYPMGLEGGTKNQPQGRRVRKVVSRDEAGKRRADEKASKAYHALTWHVRPQHNVAKAFEASGDQALSAMMAAFVDELGKIKP